MHNPAQENAGIWGCCAICRVLDRKLDDLFWEDGQALPDSTPKSRHFLERDYAFRVEPEAGINDPQEFNDELCRWAYREHHDLEILTNSMEPEVIADGVRYRCVLGEPESTVSALLMKKLNVPMVNHKFGAFMGYKWIYFYKIEKN